MSEHQAIAAIVIFVGCLSASVSLANVADRKGDGWGLFGSLAVAAISVIGTLIVYNWAW